MNKSSLYFSNIALHANRGCSARLCCVSGKVESGAIQLQPRRKLFVEKKIQKARSLWRKSSSLRIRVF